jgi:hypothetical protein
MKHLSHDSRPPSGDGTRDLPQAYIHAQYALWWYFPTINSRGLTYCYTVRWCCIVTEPFLLDAIVVGIVVWKPVIIGIICAIIDVKWLCTLFWSSWTRSEDIAFPRLCVPQSQLHKLLDTPRTVTVICPPPRLFRCYDDRHIACSQLHDVRVWTQKAMDRIPGSDSTGN